MYVFHSGSFKLLGRELKPSSKAAHSVTQTEQRLGISFPTSVREWYHYDDSIDILYEHSNQDPPIAISALSLIRWNSSQLLPFKNENQGVCKWAILLDGTDDPPVYVDVDSNGRDWQQVTSTFSAYVKTCIWDYKKVLNQPELIEAQNAPLSSDAVAELERILRHETRTFGWPGHTQYRFYVEDFSLLIWASEKQSDWHLGALNKSSLESGLQKIKHLDDVGDKFYDFRND
jgi:hypothetical protein